MLSGPSTIPASLLIGAALYGIGNAVIGGTPTTSTQFYIQAGTSVQTLNGSAGGAVNFPVAFPNGVVTVMVSNGDNGTLSQPSVIQNQVSNAAFGFQYSNSIGTASIRMNWLAIGW